MKNLLVAIVFFVIATLGSSSIEAQQSGFTNWKVAPGRKTGTTGKGIWYRYKEIRNSSSASEYVYQFKSQVGASAKVSWSIPYTATDGSRRNERLSATFKNGSNQAYSSAGWRFFAAPRQQLVAYVETTVSEAKNASGSSNGKTASIQKLWNDKVRRNSTGQLQLTLHSQLRIAGYQHENCTVKAEFFSASSGNPLKDFDHKNRDSKGNVLITERFVPKHVDTIYKDFKIPVPVFDLHLRDNQLHNLKYRLSVYTYDRVKSQTTQIGQPATGSFSVDLRRKSYSGARKQEKFPPLLRRGPRKK